MGKELNVVSIRSTLFEELKRQTENLPPFPLSVKGVTNKYFKEYRMAIGRCFAWHLFENEQVGIHKWFNSAGTRFPAHQHEENEWMFIFEGEMILEIEGKVVRLSVGDMYNNPPHVIHHAKFNVDTEYITLLHPPSEDFPHGRSK